MSNKGKKNYCEYCEIHFYDFNKKPSTCPTCYIESEFRETMMGDPGGEIIDPDEFDDLNIYR